MTRTNLFFCHFNVLWERCVAGVRLVRTRVLTLAVTGVVTVGPVHKLAASGLQLNEVHTLTEEVAPRQIRGQVRDESLLSPPTCS